MLFTYAKTIIKLSATTMRHAMRLITLSAYSALLATSIFAAPVSANPSESYEGTYVQRGTVISAGRVDPSKNVGNSYFLDANYSSVALNGGISSKKFGKASKKYDNSTPEYRVSDEWVHNAYVGIGFSRLIQFQLGYGTEGQVFRVRSDFNYRAIVDFLTQTHTPKHRLTVADRLTFTLAAERYQGKYDAFNNVNWGIGLLF